MTLTESLYHVLKHFHNFVVHVTDLNFSLMIDEGHLKYSSQFDDIIFDHGTLTLSEVKTFTVQDDEEENDDKNILVTFEHSSLQLHCIENECF